MHALRRLILGIIVLAILASPLVAVLNGWVGGKHWPMKHMQVSAPFHFVTPEQVQKVTVPYLSGGFFAVDLNTINSEIGSLHWVEHVEVRKKWPDTLVVHIKEHRPIALWNSQQMLAEEGSIFTRPNIKLPVLPQFNGNALQAQEMLSFYQKSQPLFRAVGLSITSLSLSERNAWRVQLSDGLVLDIGRNDVDLRLARFVVLLPKIRREDSRQLVHADLRYTNGFALVWQDQPAKAETLPVAENNNGQAII